MKRDASITIRLPQALKDAIVSYAQVSHRSTGQLITMVMGEYLEKVGEYKTPKSTKRGSARGRTRAKRK